MLKNSVVLVVADHDARVMGDALVPINRFHIPGFIISEEVGAKLDDTLVSQIDLAPTLLSLLGINAATPMIGQYLSNLPKDYTGRAIMQYGEKQAFYTGSEITVLQPNKINASYHVSNNIIQSQVTNSESKPNPQVTQAIAFAQFASWVYKHQKYSVY